MTTRDHSGDVDALIEQFQRLGLRELHLRAEGLEVYVSADSTSVGIDAAPGTGVAAKATPPASTALGAAPRADPSNTPAPVQPAAPEWPADATIVRAPYLGTFYRSPKPGSPAYVEVGSRVVPESELCLVEVMKLFTSVRGGVSGTVHAILAKDGQMVEAQQPLFVLVPGL
ncbi:MAG TPA: biotin/lipoyl-containing protein [Steroidobacteraceae bacterium]